MGDGCNNRGVKTAPKPSLPPLQDALDRITENTRALVQAERLAISEHASEELFATGIEDRILRAGAPMPPFTLPDALTGKPVCSADLLALGPLVVKFFRGRWCPYCITELEHWREVHAEVRALGAFFVAISPQTQRHNDFTLQQLHLPFPILSDTGAELAERFGIAYSVPAAQRAYYKGILVNIPFVNSGAMYKDAPESSWRLPLPAVFVVRQDGTIAFSEGHADFRVRPEPSDVMEALAALVPLPNSSR
jgi:peroxiredoxin